MKDIDTFEFLPAKLDASDNDHDRWIDVLSTDWGGTAYEHKLPDVFITGYEVSGSDATAALLLPAVQSVKEAATKEHSANYPNNDWAMDLIDWALDQIA